MSDPRRRPGEVGLPLLPFYKYGQVSDVFPLIFQISSCPIGHPHLTQLQGPKGQG